LLIAVFCWCVPFSGAQEQEAAKKPAEQVQKPVNAYRLDFSVNEMEDGKKINSRQYSMYLKANDYSEIKIGNGFQWKRGGERRLSVCRRWNVHPGKGRRTGKRAAAGL